MLGGEGKERGIYSGTGIKVGVGVCEGGERGGVCVCVSVCVQETKLHPTMRGREGGELNSKLVLK